MFFIGILLFLLILSVVLILITILSKMDNDIKDTLILDYFFSEEKNVYNSYEYKSFSHLFNQTDTYEIWIFGAKVKSDKKGGKGGKVCAKHKFLANTKLNYKLRGREAGGKGGKLCGRNEGNAYNGAGRASAKYIDGFMIVAGGGGGSSESGNEGGDACETEDKNGEGVFGDPNDPDEENGHDD